MGSVEYAFRGQKIYDENGTYLVTVGRTLSGRSVRWEPADFINKSNLFDFKNKEHSKRLTDALWHLHKQNAVYEMNSDWVV